MSTGTSGVVLAIEEIDEGLPDYLPDGGVRRQPTQITLMACEECGAVVSGGFGQNRHAQWHVTIAGAMDGIPTDLPY